ncbi:hypothetical protein Slin_0468 [Spirosoma linguale DSM 74]|uniref:Uncharacterized protein n=1 Tax=Spirosoma linguale (strain ATCC 33905 / DSM 74 / LMG 10896 / Claus 1) TaxID=504472 RepID=D2QF55_SPILD|nr:hypothetical protein Slin_0468 [Spirosoma linguale DSM 74]
MLSIGDIKAVDLNNKVILAARGNIVHAINSPRPALQPLITGEVAFYSNPDRIIYPYGISMGFVSQIYFGYWLVVVR